MFLQDKTMKVNEMKTKFFKRLGMALTKILDSNDKIWLFDIRQGNFVSNLLNFIISVALCFILLITLSYTPFLYNSFETLMICFMCMWLVITLINYIRRLEGFFIVGFFLSLISIQIGFGVVCIFSGLYFAYQIYWYRTKKVPFIIS